MVNVELPNLLWYGNRPRTISFPDGWEVDFLQPPGFRKRGLSDAEIARALENPIGTQTLRELAKNASEAVVVFDDITRPTPVAELLPPVLAALGSAGLERDCIRLIPALGMHGAMGNIELRKKLGTGVLREYRVFNPNPFQNCEYLGDTEGGLPVHVNREFMSCDLKIGIGCITPHVHVGFGGGGKIVLPGVCGVDTITGFHTSVMARDPQSIGLGRFDGNVMYGEVCEVARMAGLDFKVDALINTRGEVTDLFAGDVVEAHLAGVEVAREHYATPPVAGRDVMVVNSYAKYNEMAISMMMALPGVNFENGTIVLIVDAPEGQVCHYLMRSFGKEYGGECYIRREPLPDTIKVIVCSVYQDRTMTDLFAPADSVTYTSDWGETLAMLEAACPDGGTAAVVPDGTMQYYAAAG